MHTKNLIFKV